MLVVMYQPVILCFPRHKCTSSTMRAKMKYTSIHPSLLAITSAPDQVRNKQVTAYVDNMGSVRWWYKGWANGCNLGNSIIIALHLDTKALNVDLYIHHIPRCSCREALVADAISKGDFRVFRTLMRSAERFPRRAPKSLECWVKNPKPDRDLGNRILHEMSLSTRVLGFATKGSKGGTYSFPMLCQSISFF